MLYWCIVFVLQAFCITSGVSKLKVQYAAVIYRHGDRTPINTYPNDPYANVSLWPVKFGELTNIGVQQHYKLGIWLKERYHDILSEQYDPKEIYVRSTDTDRTIASALANLAGMYPPEGKFIWNKNLLWRPIPVHSIPKSMDNILGMTRQCKAYEWNLYIYKRSKDYINGLSKYTDLMKYLSVNSGRLIEDYRDIEYLYSVLFIEQKYFSLPPWTQSVFPDKMKAPACHSFTIPTATQKLARLKSGPLLKEITNDMVHFAKKKNHTRKVTVYSAHDDTVASLLNAMRMFDGDCPEYTATVLIELLNENASDNLNDMFVRISYRNSTKIVEPYTLYIPNCGNYCPLQQFLTLQNDLITVNWDAECAVPKIQITYYLCVITGALAIIHIYLNKQAYGM